MAMAVRFPRVVAVVLIAMTAIISPAWAAGTTELVFDTQDFAPFNYAINGVVSGPAADIIRKVCGDMKIECPMRLLPWRRAQQEVDEGTAHALFVIGWNPERAKSLYFSPPLLNTEYGIFVRSDNPLAFKQTADLKDYVIGVYGPSNTATALGKIHTDAKEFKVEETPDDYAAFKKLSLGRVDAVFSNKDVGDQVVQKLDLKNVRYAGRQQVLKYYIGFSQKFVDKKLVDRFNDTFAALHKQGVIQEILSRYRMTAAALE
jgi:polar amino acid transport system substrate-binding protein